MNIKSLFNTSGNGKYLDSKLKEELEKGIGEIEDIVAGYILNEAQEQSALVAKQIEFLLNQNERMYPRQDPALKGLRTDQWKVYAYLNVDKNSKQMRKTNGQYDFKFRFVAINMQKPYYYHFDFTDYNYRLGGKVLMNTPVFAISDKERKRLTKKGAYRNLPTGYQLESDIKYLSKQKSYRESGKPKKVMGRMNHTVGNLAAVRLALDGPIVHPTKAKRIVFWVNHAKRLDKNGKALKGRSMGSGGYVFVQARMYNIGGHNKYREVVDSIIDSEINTFMDKLW